MSDSRIVNLRDLPGKGFKRELPPDVVRVDRWSKWGNQYRVGAPDPMFTDGRTMDLDMVLSYYEIWLGVRVMEDPLFIEPLRRKRLGCWCRPNGGFQGQLLCHAQVIVAYQDGCDPSEVE